jgi:alkylation response protein AidB-like acyl-CoA dehydrogenase
MGLHGSPTHAVTYEDVRVPLGNLIGEEGKGLHQTLATLDGGRIGIGAISVGLAQAAFEHAVNYARERKAFGKPIAEQQAIQWMLADAATEIEIARLMVYTSRLAQGSRDATTTRKPPWPRCSPPKWRNASAVTPSRSTADTAIRANIPSSASTATPA